MINFKRKLKNFGPLEFLVLSSLLYVIGMLIWTGTTRSEVLQKASDIKSNHKMVVELINNCLLYTSPSPRDGLLSRMPSSA